tara:strand:+ start:212 stop:808 length:597 start_codon:yes stop_codon:yes gene_type:complete
MGKLTKQVSKEDLLSIEQYSLNRKKIRKDLLKFKKNRRIHLGPYATFYFECYETMLAQIQEMLFIEKGGDEQLKDELIAYNPLIPQGNELIATLMFEIDNPLSRAEFLNKVGGIEEKVFIQINNDEKINSIPEKDLDRTNAEGKASSVQFIHFNFSNQQIDKFKNLNHKIILGINHKLYDHSVVINNETRKALISDFS